MDVAKATAMVRMLLGSYPDAQPHDPETYTGQLIHAFCQYPVEAGKGAVGTLTDRCKRIPSKAHVVEALNEAMKPIKAREAAAREDERRRRELADQSAVRKPPTEEQIARVRKAVAEINERNRMPGAAPPETPKPNHVPMSDEREEQAFRNVNNGRVL